MATVTTPGEGLRFYPQDQWGLDYLFQTCNKLYIADILLMEEYPMFPGAFAYNNHPVYKVDVLGVVVRIEERSKMFLVCREHRERHMHCKEYVYRSGIHSFLYLFFAFYFSCETCFAVDDGTGVIPVACWKTKFGDIPDPDSLFSIDPQLAGKVEELKSSSRERTVGYSLGDLVHIKGKLQIFRNMKEIVSFYHKKVENSMYEVLRMLELPALYKNHYDKPFRLPYKVAQELKLKETEAQTGVISETTKAKQLKPLVKDFLQKKNIVNVCARNLLANEEFRRSVAEIVSDQAIGEDNGQPVSVVKHALSFLEQEGDLCQKSGQPGLYETLFQACPLDTIILSILRTECSKEKYSEKGCHMLHLLDELQKSRQYCKLQKAGLITCLGRLEAQSDVISATSNHYLVFS
ncbi:CST complex subunit STN1-like [Liolophura sinensis]|uniref:CST complex subunit STN1-like n=1 Tax=Liolophura sinensis TaxID=3198878 RepID=UPI0031592E5B